MVRPQLTSEHIRKQWRVDSQMTSGSYPAGQKTTTPPRLCRRGAKPLGRDPADGRLPQPPEVCPQLSEGHGDVPVHDHLVQHVTLPGFRAFGRVNHIFKIFLLRKRKHSNCLFLAGEDDRFWLSPSQFTAARPSDRR